MFSKLVGFFKQAATPLSSNNSQTLSQNPLNIDNKNIKNNENNINKFNKENNNPNENKGENLILVNKFFQQNEKFCNAMEHKQQKIMQYKIEKVNENIQDKEIKEFFLKNAETNKQNFAQKYDQIDNTLPISLNSSNF